MKLYELSGLGNISQDIVDEYQQDLMALYETMKLQGKQTEAALAKSVMAFIGTENSEEVILNALEKSENKAIYQDLLNVFHSENLGDLSRTVLGQNFNNFFLPEGNVTIDDARNIVTTNTSNSSTNTSSSVKAPNDSETRKLINYFADYYRRKYNELYRSKKYSFYDFLQKERGLVNKGTTDMLRRSSKPGTAYSIPYRVAYQDFIQYDNNKLLADARRLGIADFSMDQNQETVEIKPQTIVTQNIEATKEPPMKTLPPSQPGNNAVATRDLNINSNGEIVNQEEEAEESKLMAFFNKNKKLVIGIAAIVIVTVTGFIVFKPKKKKRGLSGVRRKRRTTTRKKTTRRRRTTRAKASTPKRRTTTRKKSTKRKSTTRKLQRPKLTVSRSKPKKKTSTSKRKTTRRSTTKKRA